MNISLASLNLLMGSKTKNMTSMKSRGVKTYGDRKKFYKDQNLCRYWIHFVQLVNNVLYYKYTQVKKKPEIFFNYIG